MKEKYLVLDIETTGLNPWYGCQITCICAKDSEGKKYDCCVQKKDVDIGERNLIENFLNWVSNRMDHKIITKNGKMFDIPFICTRSIITEAKGYSGLLEMNHFDLQEITKKRVSLSDMATLFSCENKSGDGKKAIKLWFDCNYKELIKYCMQDVEVTEQVYKKYLYFKREHKK